MHVQLAKQKNLQTLSDFVVQQTQWFVEGCRVRKISRTTYMENIPISWPQNANELVEASLANMKMKEQLDVLAIEGYCGGITSDSQIQSVILEHEQHGISKPKDLKLS